MQRTDPNRAVELLQATSAIELGMPTASRRSPMCPVYLRGEAYLLLHNGNSAAAEFQKFIHHRGLVANSSWGSLARLGLLTPMRSMLLKTRPPAIKPAPRIRIFSGSGATLIRTFPSSSKPKWSTPNCDSPNCE